MYFLEQSLIQTTTQLDVPVNTLLAANLLTRDETRQYFTSNYNSDSLTASITMSFDVTTTVSCLAMLEMNLKSFNVFYNGATANSLALVSGSDTTTANYTGNAEKSKFLEFTEIHCTSITIDMRGTFVADSEKALGYLVPTVKLLDFDRIPSYRDYKPVRKSEEVVHKLSNGGTRINVKDKKFNVDVKLKYITETFKQQLNAIHTQKDEFMYVAFPRTTDWDEIFFPCVWEGSFDFENYSSNAEEAGFEGVMKLRETP